MYHLYGSCDPLYMPQINIVRQECTRKLYLTPTHGDEWDYFESIGKFTLAFHNNEGSTGIQLDKLEGEEWISIIRTQKKGTFNVGTFDSGKYRLGINCNKPPYYNCKAHTVVKGNVETSMPPEHIRYKRPVK